MTEQQVKGRYPFTFKRALVVIAVLALAYGTVTAPLLRSGVGSHFQFALLWFLFPVSINISLCFEPMVGKFSLSRWGRRYLGYFPLLVMAITFILPAGLLLAFACLVAGAYLILVYDRHSSLFWRIIILTHAAILPPGIWLLSLNAGTVSFAIACL